jgi:hypothetical protein
VAGDAVEAVDAADFLDEVDLACEVGAVRGDLGGDRIALDACVDVERGEDSRLLAGLAEASGSPGP